MDSLIDLIFDNIWLIIAGIVFLVGFRKSKKKKDRPTKPSPPQAPETYTDAGHEADPSPKNPWDTMDDLPIPEVLKKAVREQFDPEESRRKDAPWSEPKKETSRSEGKPLGGGHYDTPWSGEGKVLPHREVTPSIKNNRKQHYDAPWSGEGKVAPHREVSASVRPSNVAAAMKPLERNSYATTSVLTPQKMTEAVILSEILGKPKALRGKNQR
ncbi:MAG TPA: hypothetical protein H9669_09550 [Firmicutes bacterium]|nr:hypothetical protein [Bacillota bacterium]